MDRAGESDEPHHPLTADSVCERNGASSRVGDASFFFLFADCVGESREADGEIGVLHVHDLGGVELH